MLAAVCLKCAGIDGASTKILELEAAGYTVTVGYCADCIARFHLDSIKGTALVIPTVSLS